METKDVPKGVRPKSPEAIKAQVAAFAAETVPDNWDRKYIFNNIAKLAESNSKSISKTTTRTEYPDGLIKNKIPSGTERIIATNEEYLQYLRSVSGSRSESIRGRTDMLTAYDQFAPEVKQLMEELSDFTTRRNHPTIIGEGTTSMVFSMSLDGKDYAVRVPRGKDTNPLVIDGHIAGAILGKGIPHFEQIVAASYEDGVTVSERMQGKEVGYLSLSDIENISDSQLNEAVSTLITARERGISIDLKASNFFYDTESGFGIVDYSLAKDIDGEDVQGIGELVGGLAGVISGAGFNRIRAYNRTSEDYKALLALEKVGLGVLKRFRPIIERNLTGEDLAGALEKTDSMIYYSERSIERYSDPIWVSEQIKADEDRRKNREKEPKPSAGPLKIELDIVE